MTNDESIQLTINLEVLTSKEVDGLEMGVFKNGIPFLTARALAKVSGVAHTSILRLSESWQEEGGALRGGKMAEILAGNGFDGDALYVRTKQGAQTILAFPDNVCMAILEYYAFEAGRHCTEEAKNNFRILARKSLREFIYRMTGYDPNNVVPPNWKHFHDRMLLNPVPSSYFSVFREIADIVIASIREGLMVNHSTVPDISVGQAWGVYWKANDLEEKYGPRTKHPHIYPDYFPQSQANIEAFIYPLVALGEFREWMQVEYLVQKFPNYLKGKVKQGLMPATSVELLLKAVEPIETKQIRGN
jgi:hypothetical protein